MRQDKARGGFGYHRFEIHDADGRHLGDVETRSGPIARVRMRVTGQPWADSYYPTAREEVLSGSLINAVQHVLGLCVASQWPEDLRLVEVEEVK